MSCGYGQITTDIVSELHNASPRQANRKTGSIRNIDFLVLPLMQKDILQAAGTKQSRRIRICSTETAVEVHGLVAAALFENVVAE